MHLDRFSQSINFRLQSVNSVLQSIQLSVIISLNLTVISSLSVNSDEVVTMILKDFELLDFGFCRD